MKLKLLLCSVILLAVGGSASAAHDFSGAYLHPNIPAVKEVELADPGQVNTFCAANLSCTVTGAWSFSNVGSLTVSGTQTNTGLTNVTNTGAFTDTAMDEYFKSNINSANTTNLFQQFYSTSSWDTAAVTGAIQVPASGNKTQYTSTIGLIGCGTATGGCVALGGYGVAYINNAHTFGLNSNASDCTTAICGFNTTSPTINGYEADANCNNSGSACTNIIVNGVYNTGSNATGIAFAAPLGTKGVYDFGISFAQHATAAPGASNGAIFFNPVASGATQVSQGEEYQSTFSDSTANLASWNLSAAGNMTLATSRANTGLLAPMLTAGNALCTGAITGDGCVSRSTTTGAISFGSDGNVILFRNGANSFQIIGSSFGSNTTGFNLGYTSAPWNALILGTAATNNFTMSPQATAGARTVNINDTNGVATTALPLFGSAGTAGYQTKRVASCTTAAAAASTCTTVVTWTTAFADTNYTATCTIGGVTNVPYVLNFSQLAASVTVTIANLTAAAASGTLHCKAQHD